MTVLNQLLPAPRLAEIEHVELAAPPERVWQRIRYGELTSSALVRALFAVRGLPRRLAGKPVATALHVDDLRSSPGRPGFQLLGESAPNELTVGAIGRVWRPDIPFVHVSDAAAFAGFAEPGYVKVAWSIRILPWGRSQSRLEFELRVDATDEATWRTFRNYFRVIGPASRFIRRSLLSALADELGTPDAVRNLRPLPGDRWLPDARLQLTHTTTIAAEPSAVWPWLVQMGCRRAGFYSIDLLDNAGIRSARDIHPELQDLHVGQVIPATPRGEDGFEVLAIEPERMLLLGGLYDTARRRQLPFHAPRPDRYRQVTCCFVLERLAERVTRVHVRARASFPGAGRLRTSWPRALHHMMQTAMLRHLAARAEGRLPRDGFREVAQGVAGAAAILFNLFTPFLRGPRSHRGLSERAARRRHPGDELVPEPRWSFTHGLEIDAPAAEVWPWIAQIGADRGGFYSYQWLENLAGCNLRNAEAVHPEWELELGDRVLLHPKERPVPVAQLERGRYLVLHAPPDRCAREAGKPGVAMSWLFLIEPLGATRCRLVSRYRAASSGDLKTLLGYGLLGEAISSTMDRRMLYGIKQRAERRFQRARRADRPAPPHQAQVSGR